MHDTITALDIWNYQLRPPRVPVRTLLGFRVPSSGCSRIDCTFKVPLSVMCIHIYIHIYIHACIHTYMQTYMHIHTSMHACTHACMHTCMHARTHTYTHECIHTHINNEYIDKQMNKHT